MVEVKMAFGTDAELGGGVARRMVIDCGISNAVEATWLESGLG
jgi:hypothetical protein